MKAIHNIRALYQPVQPAAGSGDGGVVYHEFLPDLLLQEYIYCYWQLKTDRTLTAPYHYRVVADGCIDLFFELQHPRESYVMGFSNAYTAFPLEGSFHYVGIRFMPGMFPLLYRINAAELTNAALPLDEVIPAVARFLGTRFHPDLTVPQIKSLLDGYFLTAASKAVGVADSRLYESIDFILQTAGTVRIENELPNGISARQLRRLFTFYVGDTPKVFSEVVRFQKVLQSAASVPSIRKHRSYLDAGYYDQAHFIKAFKKMYGLTPAKVFEK